MKGKAVVIVENLPVPFDTRVWKDAVSLRRAGYRITVLCPKGKDFEQGHEVPEGAHIYRHLMPQEGNTPLGYVWEYWCALFRGFLIFPVDVLKPWISRHSGL